MTYVSETRVDFEALRSAAFGAVGASYTAMGNPTSHPAVALKVRSTLDQDCLLSINGVTDQIPVAASDNFILDFGANKEGTGKLYLAQDTTIYQKQGAAGAPGSGNLYVAVIYAR